MSANKAVAVGIVMGLTGLLTLPGAAAGPRGSERPPAAGPGAAAGIAGDEGAGETGAAPSAGADEVPAANEGAGEAGGGAGETPAAHEGAGDESEEAPAANEGGGEAGGGDDQAAAAPGGAEAVSFAAGKTRLAIGAATTLWGRISPAAEDETVQIVTGDGGVVGNDITDEDGRFSLRFAPRRNLRLRARWEGVMSDPVALKVKPKIVTNISGVRLFGKARARGYVAPAMPGKRVTVKLVRSGRTVATKRVRLRDGGRSFSARFAVSKPGTYRSRALVENRAFLFANDFSNRSGTTPLPNMGPGARSPYVRLLEKRLRTLGYYLPGADRSFSYRTADALRAFNKVQGRPRVGTVDAGTWRKLADPFRPRPRFASPNYHIEINQTKQVIFIFKGGKVQWMLHSSTGANGATRDGSWTVTRKLAGYSPNRLYYPSYFDGLRAIHGWPSVPTYPASHGCARVPMWSAKWIYSKAPLGTRVYVYH